eukprot:s2805_g8.t1
MEVMRIQTAQMEELRRENELLRARQAMEGEQSGPRGDRAMVTQPDGVSQGDRALGAQQSVSQGDRALGVQLNVPPGDRALGAQQSVHPGDLDVTRMDGVFKVLLWGAARGRIRTLIGGPPRRSYLVDDEDKRAKEELLIVRMLILAMVAMEGRRQLRSERVGFALEHPDKAVELLIVRMLILAMVAMEGRRQLRSERVGFALEHPDKAVAQGNVWSSSLWTDFCEAYGMELLRPHRRVAHKSAYVLSADVAGPFRVKGVSTETNQHRFMLVCAYQFPKLPGTSETQHEPLDEDTGGGAGIGDLLFEEEGEDNHEIAEKHGENMRSSRTRLHADRAREFRTPAVSEWAASRDILVTRTEGDSPAQNGTAEQAVKYLKARTRILLASAQDSSGRDIKEVKTWWPMAAETAEQAVKYLKARTRILLASAQDSSGRDIKEVKTWWPMAAETAATRQRSLVFGMESNPPAGFVSPLPLTNILHHCRVWLALDACGDLVGQPRFDLLPNHVHSARVDKDTGMRSLADLDTKNSFGMVACPMLDAIGTSQARIGFRTIREQKCWSATLRGLAQAVEGVGLQESALGLLVDSGAVFLEGSAKLKVYSFKR